MDKELAEMVANAAVRSQRELGELLPTIKEHCSPEKHGVFLLAIGSAIYEAGLMMESFLISIPI